MKIDGEVPKTMISAKPRIAASPTMPSGRIDSSTVSEVATVRLSVWRL
jgi:hypothetical protein